MKIVFCKNDLMDFSRVSGDKNPLHIDEVYARKTSYGEVVVFGILALIKSLPLGMNKPIKNIKVRFLKAIHLNQDYTAVYSHESADKTTCSLLMGSTPVMKVVLEFSNEEDLDQKSFEKIDHSHSMIRSEINLTDMQKSQFSGTYSADSAYVENLLTAGKISSNNYHQIQSLIFSSYQIGMISPGERALFLELNLNFNRPAGHISQLINYETKITKHDRRFDHLTYEINIQSNKTQIASGSLKAFARPASSSNVEIIQTYKKEQSTNLVDKNVLIIGGSRGLGAHITALFASHGAHCHVVYQNSVVEATLLKNEFKNISLYKADASVCDDMYVVQKAIAEKNIFFDMVICTATPPLQSLVIEIPQFGKFENFIKKSLNLASMPLFIWNDDLTKKCGHYIYISSTVVNEVVREWPHYVASKCLAEGFIKTAALQFKKINFLILRPSRLDTDLTKGNIPSKDVESAEGTARKVLDFCLNGNSTDNLKII